MEGQFKGKVAVVTGSSFGIGRAAAILFAKRGASLVLADWVEDQDTLSSIGAFGGEAIFVKCDISNEEDVKSMVEKAVSRFGRLDYAFNNAGIEGHSALTHEAATEHFDKTVGVNLRGTWLCMKYEIAEMLKHGKGAIVNNASIAGLVGFQRAAAYVASKHGVLGLTKTAALEYAKNGIRVNAICPGVIRTPMVDRYTGKQKEIEKQFADMEPIGRLGEPEEVAELAIWLCSDAASFITGDAIAVDGGWVAQ